MTSCTQDEPSDEEARAAGASPGAEAAAGWEGARQQPFDHVVRSPLPCTPGPRPAQGCLKPEAACCHQSQAHITALEAVVIPEANPLAVAR